MPHDLNGLSARLSEHSKRFADLNTRLALLEHRMASVEKVVYGAAGAALLTLLGAIIALALKK